MNVFFVPQLGSEIYTMPGMVSRLALQADKPGQYPGLSANFSGSGFSDMRFVVDAVPSDQFSAWVKATKGNGPTLDLTSYTALSRPSQNVPPSTYGSIDDGLFLKIAHPDTVPVVARATGEGK
jgi:cytochrome o ubiquinol oxidase subunit 2